MNNQCFFSFIRGSSGHHARGRARASYALLMEPARFVYASDQSLLVCLGEAPSPETHERVAKLTRSLQSDPLPGVLNLHPAYCSVLVRFNALLHTHGEMERVLAERIGGLNTVALPPPRIAVIPVRYGGEYGPDLEDVAALHGMTPAQVVGAHASAEYTVRFLGFAPGFAYLGGLPDSLATPRLDAPRRQVPAGSVAIGGAQTGIYPFPTPGGWRIIGRTDLVLFDPEREPACLLQLGDHVRFEPVR